MRKWLVKITDYPNFEDKFYASKILSINKFCKNAFQVEFQILASIQTGRQVTTQLPLPIRPQGLSISLFKACGYDLKVEDQFCPKDAIGKEIMCKFKQTINGVEAVTFKSIQTKEPNHDE